MMKNFNPDYGFRENSMNYTINRADKQFNKVVSILLLSLLS